MSVFFYGCVSLDGYLADRDHRLDWLHQTGGVEETGYDDFYRQMDITIMGRRTFREIERMEDPGAFYPTTRNYVFTHDTAPLPEGFVPVRGDVVEFVKGQPGEKNIWVSGGNTILAPLLDAGIVDGMTIQLAPVLLGAGIPLFTQGEGPLRFRLEKAVQYGQFAELVYTKQ